MDNNLEVSRDGQTNQDIHIILWLNLNPVIFPFKICSLYRNENYVNIIKL